MSKNHKTKKRYNRIAPVYDKFEFFMEKLAFNNWREKLWNKVKTNTVDGDRLLEAGVGTGKNIPHYPKGLDYTAIDFSPKMLTRAKERAKNYDLKINFEEMDIQELDFQNNYFDLIVTSCVFCSVPDPVLGLKELKRVLKSDGKIYMLEHVKSQKFLLGQLMELLNFIPKNIWGANIDRYTEENIERAGLEIKDIDNLWLDIFKLISVQK